MFLGLSLGRGFASGGGAVFSWSRQSACLFVGVFRAYVFVYIPIYLLQPPSVPMAHFTSWCEVHWFDETIYIYIYIYMVT